ncbi:MAG: hypothetical protein LBI12_06125 [Treponema sp.]|jgi:hypothetical protein|nr:hypothetical protein [Treponema sp.]
MRYKFIWIFLALFFFGLFPAAAQEALFKPFTSLRVIKTEYFDIIFPSESESSARQLASYADQVYEYVSSLLGIVIPGRIPVTFTPHTDMFNGYFSRTSNHIVLFDTPMDIEWTAFADNLKGLFLHELTHAISLNSRSPFYQFMHRIFGNWVSPTWINAPLFMVEGVTISFESLDGTGRANDPLAKHYLRQAIHEGKLLTPFQASGVYDRPIQPSGYYYEYGGLFSSWLQQTYGMEKYAQLWQSMGRTSRFSFFVYRSGFYRIFKNTYNIDFIDAWNAFGASMTLNNLETNNDELLPVKYRYFSEKEQFIRSLTARGNNLYYINSTERKIGIYDTLTGTIRTFNTSYLAYDLDVSADGTTLLLSGYRNIESRYLAAVTEYKTDGRNTGRAIEGLYKARYFRGGVIGIRSDLHNTCIVYEDFNGKREILLRGNQELIFSGPQVIDDERIVFIAAQRGERKLWLYNYVSQELFQIESSDGSGEYRSYIRGLYVSEGKLFFSHNSDDRMYKLGLIDLDTMQATFSSRDFSGGVFNPVSTGDSVYYLGTFVSRNSLLRFPEKVSSLSGIQNDLHFVKLEPAEERQYLIHGSNEYIEPLYSEHSKTYMGIKYMNPFNFWFPVPLIRIYENNDKPGIRLDGGGIFSLMTDPTDRNMIITMVNADIRYKMASIDMFSWQNNILGFPLTLNFSDTVVESANNPYRSTNVSLNGSIFWSSGLLANRFSLGGGYVRNANHENDKGAYQWNETGKGFYLHTGYSFSYHKLFSLQFSGISLLNNFAPRADGVFRINAETRFPVNFIFYGAYDERGMDLHGISNTYSSTLVTGFTMNEYSHPFGLNLAWLAGSEFAVGLFSFQIQRNLSHLYFNNVFGTLALRNQIYDSKGHQDAEGYQIGDYRIIQSLMLKLGVKMSFFPLVKFPATIEPYVSGAWKFSNTITGEKSQLAFDWGLNLSY